MNLLYITFGEDISYHVQAILSIRSWQKQLTENDRIIMMTSSPQFYKRQNVDIVEITEQMIEDWRGGYSYFFRCKIKAMEFIAEKYPNEHMIFADTDTFLYEDLSLIRNFLDLDKGFMHTCEGHPSQMKGSSRRMWNAIKGHKYKSEYGDIIIGEKHVMWNSGIVAIPKTKLRQIIKTALAVCDGILKDGVTCFNLEQYAQSIAMTENLEILSAQNIIGHYWGNKQEWEKIATDFIIKSYMQNLTLEEELEAVNDELFHKAPIYVHHSNTAKRLHQKIDAWFKVKEKKFIEKAQTT